MSLFTLSREWLTYEVPIDKFDKKMIPAETFYLDKNGKVQKMPFSRNIYSFLTDLVGKHTISNIFDITEEDTIKLLKENGYDKIRVQRKIRPERYILLGAILSLCVYLYSGNVAELRSMIVP
jgi:hypothetical protein